MDTQLHLKVLVVGGGPAGLALAIALLEKGHSVNVIESAAEFIRLGAGLHVAPNAARILIRMGLRDKMEKYVMAMKRIRFYRHTDGEQLVEQSYENVEKEQGAPFWQIHRGDLHKVLLEHAVKLGVTITMGTRIASYDFGAPSVALADGQVISADVIVAADGIKSQARSLMLGRKDEPRDTGKSVYRMMIPCNLLQGDPEVKELVTDSSTHIWMGAGRHAIGYTIRRGEYFNVGLTQAAKETAQEIYTALKNPKEILEEYEGWDPR